MLHKTLEAVAQPLWPLKDREKKDSLFLKKRNEKSKIFIENIDKG